jgi:hypothetical protein
MGNKTEKKKLESCLCLSRGTCGESNYIYTTLSQTRSTSAPHVSSCIDETHRTERKVGHRACPDIVTTRKHTLPLLVIEFRSPNSSPISLTVTTTIKKMEIRKSLKGREGKGTKSSPNVVSFQSLRERNIRLLLSLVGLLTKELCNYSYPSDIKKENYFFIVVPCILVTSNFPFLNKQMHSLLNIYNFKIYIKISYIRSYMFRSTWTILRELMLSLAKVTLLYN